MGEGCHTRAVIFDLDGTLVQTRRASWELFQEISKEFGLGLTGPDDFYTLFNDNVFAAIRTLCQDDDCAEKVAREFLRRLREDYAPPMIPGMADVVRSLARHCTLAVLSSNAMTVVRQILLTNGIAYCFAHVFAGDLEPDKRDGIRRFLSDAGRGFGRRCEVYYDEANGPYACDQGTTVLVTDTVGDVKAAVAEGIRAVAVSWGMHTPDELWQAGAEFVAIWPQELVTYLLGEDGIGGRRVNDSCAIPPAADDIERERPSDVMAARSRSGSIRRRQRQQAGVLARRLIPWTTGTGHAASDVDQSHRREAPPAVPDQLRLAVARICHAGQGASGSGRRASP